MRQSALNEPLMPTPDGLTPDLDGNRFKFTNTQKSEQQSINQEEQLLKRVGEEDNNSENNSRSSVDGEEAPDDFTRSMPDIDR